MQILWCTDSKYGCKSIKRVSSHIAFICKYSYLYAWTNIRDICITYMCNCFTVSYDFGLLNSYILSESNVDSFDVCQFLLISYIYWAETNFCGIATYCEFQFIIQEQYQFQFNVFFLFEAFFFLCKYHKIKFPLLWFTESLKIIHSLSNGTNSFVLCIDFQYELNEKWTEFCSEKKCDSQWKLMLVCVRT